VPLSVCKALPLPPDMTTLFFPVLSVFGGGELGITVAILVEYLSGCRCDMWEGNGV
jgi:hypothetical protein